MTCLQCNTRDNQEDYNRKRIAAARVCHRKKRELIQRKVDEIVEHHTQMKVRNITNNPRRNTRI